MRIPRTGKSMNDAKGNTEGKDVGQLRVLKWKEI